MRGEAKYGITNPSIDEYRMRTMPICSTRWPWPGNDEFIFFGVNEYYDLTRKRKATETELGLH